MALTTKRRKNWHVVGGKARPHRYLRLVAVAGGLRCEAVGLTVRRRRGAGAHAGRASSDHESRSAQDGGVVFRLLLLLLLGLAGLVVSLERGELLSLLTEKVDHVRHGEVHEAVAPRELKDEVRSDELIAGVEHASVAFAVANVDKLKLLVWISKS